MALGGAGGYGLGLLTAVDSSAVAAGTAAPLGTVRPKPAPSSTPAPSLPPREVVPDNSPPLEADDLRYKTRSFTVKDVYESQVSARVPANWGMTQPDPPRTARYTDPTSKRWLRIEAGFTIQRPPAASMQARIDQLDRLPKDQMVTYVSSTVEGKYATLAYTYVPPASLAPVPTLRYVVVRWVADDSGLCAVEMSSTGLPQDEQALLAILDKASETVVRRDRPLDAERQPN
ncbi:hypothetical protein E1218_15010 [Kribbella turkmenica]|uniref:Uncharacterized protein n=1 Tax=Kribbella turkmenica TaxID=2530375 RepID=A0A4R4X4Y9_9ACTN|nr:hypothetical protein [Kribbella turkmenica]TDD25400.1 hypothetical protein E1218_15010 [Kribbella turkmenica]